MTSSQSFIEIACELQFLDAASAADLSTRLGSSDDDPAQVAVKAGLLTLEAADIVETLLHPCDAIPGYEVNGVLGRGGMGVVYKARQKNLDRIVALKTILLSRLSTSGGMARFEQEARTNAQLIHPNIVQAYDFGTHHGRLYLAMEFVAGKNAESAIPIPGGFTEFVTWHMIRQAAWGLAHAASHGVVHRDVKPGNLLLLTPPSGTQLPIGVPMVKLTDFGLARIADADTDRTRLTAEQTSVGSPPYMAPEQFSTADVDLRADIYALGITALQLATGRMPFEGLNLPQLVARKLSLEPISAWHDREKRLSEPTRQLIDEMTANELSRRVGDYGTLLHTIDDVLKKLEKGAISASTQDYIPTNVVPTPRAVPDTDVQLPTQDPPPLASGSLTEPEGVKLIRVVASQGQVAGSNGEKLALASRSSGQAFPEHRVSGTRELQPGSARSVIDGRFSRSAFIRTAAAVLLIGLGVCGVWAFVDKLATVVRQLPEPAATPLTAMRRGGSDVLLFDGETLSPWQPVSGNWEVDKTVPCIVGSSASLTKPGRVQTRIERKSAARTEVVRYWEFQMVIQRADADRVQIEFGLPSGVNEKQNRFALQLSKKQATLVKWETAQSTQIVIEDISRNTSEDSQEFHLTRLPEGWVVRIDEIEFQPILAPFSTPEPTLRIRVDAGQLKLSDLSFCELVP